MATEDPTADPSRQTNLNKCETAASDGDASESDSGDRELPTPEDVLWSCVEDLSQDLVSLPVATAEGTAIREDYVDETLENWESDPLYYCGRCDSTFAPRTQSKIDHVTVTHGDELADKSFGPADAADGWIREKRVTGQRVADVDAVPWAVAIEKVLESHERPVKRRLTFDTAGRETPSTTSLALLLRTAGGPTTSGRCTASVTAGCES